MFYRVTAKLKKETAAELYRKLRDGTVEGQEPDGQEIVDSMNRAVVTDVGDIVWSEVCYCPTPLAHERATVYNKHFDGITTETIDGHKDYDGHSFMDHLAQLAAGEEGA